MTRSNPKNSNQILLPNPVHERSALPVPRSSGRLLKSSRTELEARASIERKTTQVIQEFRSKLRVAEDLISKLAFNLREIQGTWRKSKSSKDKGSKSAAQANGSPSTGAKVVDVTGALAAAAAEERS